MNHDLEVAEKNFSQFASKNTALDIKEQGKAMVEGAAMLPRADDRCGVSASRPQANLF